MTRTKSTVAKAFALASVAALVPRVAAHGYVLTVDINGQSYTGFDESTWLNKATGSPILITDYLTPTYDVNGPNVVCGINPQNAQSIATASPGDKIGWHWVTHNGADAKTWTHNEGTHRTFIAPCNGDCTQANPSSLQWTELPSQYTGQQTYDSGSGTWPVLALANGNPWYDQVPPAPNGDYLFRNELTALHYSTNHQQDFDNSVQHGWGTEFYPTCMAIRIQGSSGTFDMSQAVSFPGAYTVDEPGHYNPNIWTDPTSVGLAALNTFPRTQGPSGGSDNSNTGSSNNNGNNSGGNNGSSSEGNVAPSSSNSAATPTVSNPLCKRRKRSLSPALGRRHHHRQARRLTGAH